MAPIKKTKEIIKKFPAIKPHLDLLAAILTIPVLLTVIILNFSNLAKSKTASPTTPLPTQSVETKTVIEKVPVPITNTANQSQCTPGIGAISIDSPKEGAVMSSNPVCITISYQSNNHCSVVWAYRINGGQWSDYSNNAVCLYNMPAGPLTFDLEVKSLVNNDTTMLERHFTYNPTSATVTQSPVQQTSPTVTPATSITTVVTPTP